MKLFHRFIILSFFLAFPAISFAVTDSEMEKAKAIATKYYLRYVNNGSDYLDKLNPETVADLEKNLKEKEKKNIEAFKKIKVPANYASWDKDKLIEYWSVTALNTPGLNEEGKKAQWALKKALQALSISVPASPTSEDKKTGTPTTDNSSDVNTQDTQTQAQIADSLLIGTETDSLAALDAEMEEIPVKKEGSYTWVYIMALAILVAAVIGLVVFASNLMKKEPPRRRENDDDRDYEELEEQYTHEIDEKNAEIGMLTKKLESANRQNAELKQKLEALTIEISSLRNRAEERFKNSEQLSETDMSTRETDHNSRYNESTSEIKEQGEPIGRSKHNPNVRTIFLGRANSKGIFVRADRKLNPGNSIFKLETTDGVSGTFTVARSPEVWDVALRLPREYLSFACIGPDLEDSIGMSRIVNDTPGTAVFEGGCWRVTRKARIHYD